jgi:PAS domain S-box-containing protein
MCIAKHDEARVLSAVLDGLAEGAVVADRNGKFLVFNKAAEDMVGLGAQDVASDEWVSVYGLYRPDKTTRYEPEQVPLARVLRGEEIIDEPIYIRNPLRPDGVWISVSGRPLKDEAGSIWGGLAILRDISRQKRAEDSLRFTTLHLSAVMNNQEMAILVESKKRRIQSINSAFCDLFQIPAQPSELIGKDCEQAAEQAKHLFKDPEGFVRRIKELVRHRRLVTCEKLYSSDGRVLERDYIPVVTANECHGHVWQYRDVTGREQAIQQITLIERLSRALEQTGDSVVITDDHGLIEYVNDAFENTTGYTRAEAIGKSPKILQSGTHDAAFYRALWARILSGKTFRGTIVNRKKNGELYWAEQTITPIKDADGRITHFVSVLKDITDLLAKKEQEVEMRLAREVQQSYYQASASVPGYEIAGASTPASETGGDYYDFISLPDGCVCIAVGDVSGHGISSALVMAETRAYVRAFASVNKDAGEILTEINRMLKADLNEGRFVTLLLICLDPRTGTITYAGAGHEYGYLLDESGDVNCYLRSTGLPLGLFSDAEFCRSDTFRLKKGQILLLLTDGLADSTNVEGDRFTAERALDYVKVHRHQTAREIADGLCRAGKSFAKEQTLTDDVTAVILRAL